jgi:NADH-quinone oxidoreductase subunit A
MLFILFDIEAIFLLPWAVVFKTLSQAITDAGQNGRAFVFLEMMIFVAALCVGYIYVWKKGLFEWNRN